MKKILLIATGGTIASRKMEDGLTPAIDVDSLIAYIPGLKEMCQLDGISIMNIDSTNMNPALMQLIAKAVADNYEDYDGFVVTHGTDTMAYSTAAVTYMFKNLSKPVVFTGSQVPIEAKNTDAKDNLFDAVCFACEDIRGVYLVFNGIAINGTRAMKVKTRSYDAFNSINYPVIAHIKDGKVTYNEILEKNYNSHWNEMHKKFTESLVIATGMCQDIIVLKVFPGIGTEIFDYVKDNYKGVIIEGFGIGGIPNKNNNIVEKLHELEAAGVTVVITTQCLYEGIDLGIYEVGQTLAKKKVVMSGDMTTEALTMKLMWALAHYTDAADVRKYMEKIYFADRSY